MGRELGLADPVSARELHGVRLRFELPSQDPTGAALRLLARATPPLSLRLVAWDDAPVAGWVSRPPDAMDATPTADEAPRRIATWLTLPDLAEVEPALRAAYSGAVELDLWLRDAEGRLWRPYDDRGVDVVASSSRVLEPLRAAFRAMLIEDTASGPLHTRCALAFACDVGWDEMAPGATAEVRRCARCARDVFRVRTEAEFQARALAGECVAFERDAFPVRLDELPPPLAGGRPLLAGMPLRPPEPPPPPDPPRPWWRRLLGR